MTSVGKFLRDESGATAIEYGLIAACISVAIIAVVQGVGTKLNMNGRRDVKADPNTAKLPATLTWDSSDKNFRAKMLPCQSGPVRTAAPDGGARVFGKGAP